MPRSQADLGLHAGAMQELLTSDLGKQLARLRTADVYDDLINDAYKPRMHKMYAHFMQGVQVDFCLNIRKTPLPLTTIQNQVRTKQTLRQVHRCPVLELQWKLQCYLETFAALQEPELFAQFQQFVEDLQQGAPLTPQNVAVLQQYYHFTVTPVRPQICCRNGDMQQRLTGFMLHQLCCVDQVHTWHRRRSHNALNPFHRDPPYSFHPLNKNISKKISMAMDAQAYMHAIVRQISAKLNTMHPRRRWSSM